MSPIKTLVVLAVLASLALACWLGLRGQTTKPTVAAESRVSSDTSASRSAALAPPLPPIVSSETTHEEHAPTQTVSPKSPTAASTDARSLVVYGFLLLAKGRAALADAAVQLIDPHGDSQIARCGADGAYSFSGLAPGHYWLSSRSPVNGSARLELDLDAGTNEKRVDLQLVVPPEVLVKATDREGKAFIAGGDSFRIGLAAVATREPPGEWLEEFNGNDSEHFGAGTFRSNREAHMAEPDAELGTLTLDHASPAYVSLVTYQHVVATQRVDVGQSEIVFVLDRDSPAFRTSSLRARFVDADTHALVDVKSVQFDAGSGSRWPQKQDGDVYAVSGLAPGWYRIQAIARGYECLRRRVRLEPGVDLDLGDVALEHEQWISGTIIDPDGKAAVMNLDWTEYDREKGPAPIMGTVYVVKSKDDGSFRVGGLSRGLYLLRTSSRETTPYAQWSQVIDTTCGPVENLRIQLVRGVALVLRASDPENWMSVRYKILDESGFVVRTNRLWTANPSKLLLAPGRYTLEASVDGVAASKRIPITIATERIELAIP